MLEPTVKVLAVFGLMMAISHAAIAAEQISPDSFYGITDGAMAKCSLTAQAIILGTEGPNALDSCISAEKRDGAKLFKMLIHLQKNAIAKAAIRKYYAGWLTIMDELKPKVGESLADFLARQDKLESDLNALGNAMKVDAESE